VDEQLESARHWRHPAVAGVDLLRARYVDHVYTRHTHEGYAIGVILGGVEEFRYRGGLHQAKAGAVVLVNPDEVHDGHAGIPAGWAYRMTYPDVPVLADIAAELGGPRGVVSFPEPVVYDSAALGAFLAAHRAAEQGADPLAASSLLRVAYGRLLRAHALPGADRRRSSASRHAVAAARETLHDRAAEPPTLEELAASVGMSPFALLRAFRAELGLPPHAYLNQLRVREAKRLLDSDQPPADVAALVGFADQAHLSRHFKRVYGVPPGAYRRERKNVQELFGQVS
jgi:AraC-like DNA-binding protein